MDSYPRDSFEDERIAGRRGHPKEESTMMTRPATPGVQREMDSASKVESFLSTKRMSGTLSRKDDAFENYVPIIKRMEEQEAMEPCEIHMGKSLKYFDISSPKEKLCSKCVLELVVDRNFNSAMTKEEFQKKKQTEDFLNNLALLGTDLGRIQDKIGREVEDLERTHVCQKTFLDNMFSQLLLLIEEIRHKYSNRVDRTFISIKEIFGEKMTKLNKFEKEMKELEKDVRLNYSNIIRLMDLEPFYEIIYRYNKKLNNIKSVFTDFKGKPDEIPEDAVKVKSIKSQMSLVSGIGKKLEYFFADNDSYDSNHVSREEECSHQGGEYDRFWSNLTTELLPALTFLGKSPKQSTFGSKSTMTETISEFEGPRKRVSLLGSAGGRDELRLQAELLIKSVDTLISHGDQVANQSKPFRESIRGGLVSPPNRLNPDFKPSKSITKAEIAKRIQQRFNSATAIGKIRSISSTSKSGTASIHTGSPVPLEKKGYEQRFNNDIDIEQIAREIAAKSKAATSKALKEHVQLSGGLYPQNNNSSIPQPNHYSLSLKSKLSRQAMNQQSAGHMHSTSKEKERSQIASQGKQMQQSKTERLLQLYKKNKQGVLEGPIVN